MNATPASGSRTATFLLRQPRQVQGFREVLAGASAAVSPFEQLIDEADDFEAFFAEGNALIAKPLALTMLWIPPGRFWMGSPPQEPERSDSEGPQQLVQLPGFFMSQTPITQAQWRAVARSPQRPGERWGHTLNPTPSRFQGDQGGLLAGEANTDNRPVEKVSWHDAREFCNRLNQRTGRHYTLPSEAQWEYACRAGTSTPFHFGATITPELANYDGSVTYANGPKGEYRKQTTPVGMFPANAWGLHDMHGTVWEWCLDHWHESYEGAPKDGSAWENMPERKKTATKKKVSDTVSNEESRLLRGGSWDDFPGGCRSASRGHGRPAFASLSVGFRVVCLPQGPSLNS